MEIKNRLFPYPVLCMENDDYVCGEFNVKYEITEDFRSFSIKFDITLSDNDELQWLIREGKADFVIHIECPTTSFREVLKSSGKKIIYNIPKSKLNGKVEFLSMIVVAQPIYQYSSKSLNDDYIDEKLNFEKGSILAYRNLPAMLVTKQYEELTGDNAFFTIIKRENSGTNERQPVAYDISDAKIKIMVDAEIYDEYIKYHHNLLMSPITNSLLIMPALAYAIDVLRNDSIDKYKELYWYQRLNKACKLQKQSFVDDYIENLEKTNIEIAQEMLQLPINCAFSNLSKIIQG